jgi:hypothetical protein
MFFSSQDSQDSETTWAAKNSRANDREVTLRPAEDNNQLSAKDDMKFPNSAGRDL